MELNPLMIKDLKDSGHSLRVIATIYGCSHQTISNVLHTTFPEINLYQRPKLKRTLTAEEFKILIEQGHTYESAGAEGNVSHERVRQIMKKHFPGELERLLKQSADIRYTNSLMSRSFACLKCGTMTTPKTTKTRRSLCYTCLPDNSEFRNKNIPHCRRCQTTKQPLMLASKHPSRDGTKMYYSMICRQCNTASHSAYIATPKGKKAAQKSVKKFEKKNPHMRSAWNQVRGAILTGKLLRPSGCSHCFKPCKPDAHHVDYTKPLEVQWLCRACHRAADAGILI